LRGNERGAKCRCFFLMRLHRLDGKHIGEHFSHELRFCQAAGEQQALPRTELLAQYFVHGEDAEDDTFKRCAENVAAIVREIEPGKRTAK
jgi:hypothetical protein